MIARRSVLAGALALPACATAPKAARPQLAPLRMEAERIAHITVCLRPLRAAGPRLDVETIGAKRIFHSYGHGGSGWSLSWGSAALAARNAMDGGARHIVVIGCGAIGITTAITLLRTGAKVTIYAAKRLPHTRSAHATGTWSPSSRSADADAVTLQFPALWQAMARTSYAEHRSYGSFRSPADFAALPQPVIVNCTGYGARALMQDESTTPVRGQIAWLAPQPEVHYGLYYKSVSILPRSDGIVVRYVGDNDIFGLGIADETPDRAEAERAIATVAPLFAAA